MVIKKKESVPDRRIQKTKKHLSEALILLIIEKGYEAVRIQDIIDKANVGRSTFYAHYESKEQLFIEGHKNLGKFLFDANPKKYSEGIDLDFLILFQHSAENHLLAKALLGKKGGEIISNHFRDTISSKIISHYKKQISRSKTEQKMLAYVADATASAIIRLLICWLDDDMPFTAEEMADKGNEILKEILRKYD